MRYTVITTSRWTEWWNVIANKESVQINKHILTKKKKKSTESNVQCCGCYIPFIYHFKLRYFDGFSAVR